MIKISSLSLKKIHLKLSSAKSRPFCPGYVVLMTINSIWNRCIYPHSLRLRILTKQHVDGFVQERRNSIANALDLRLSRTYPSMFQYLPKHILLNRFSWWRHQMETFSALLALCAGTSPVTSEFPAQSPVTRIYEVSFDIRLNKCLKNNREAGDLRRHRLLWRHRILKDNPGACEIILNSMCWLITRINLATRNCGFLWDLP